MKKIILIILTAMLTLASAHAEKTTEWLKNFQFQAGSIIDIFTGTLGTDNVINKLNTENTLISKEQTEIIFKNTKEFPNDTQIAIAIIHNGKTGFYGVKRENNTISRIDNKKNVFEIGSISKVFTSTLLADFVTDEKINLHDNINDYLNFPIHNNIKISFVELANHTSGLPRLPDNLTLTRLNFKNPYQTYQEKALEDYLINHLHLSNKGEYQYSNLGAGLLGYVLSQIDHATYENLLQSKVFAKYHMQNSTTDLNKIKGNLVKGLNSKGKITPNWEFAALAGAGAIFSTAEDLSQFAIAQFDSTNEELKLTREKTFEADESFDMGLGWHILKSQSQHPWYWHNGGTGGYSSSMLIEEKSKNAVIILSNVSAYNPNMKNIDALGFELMKTLEKE